jgi:hypothetical protein
MTRRYSTTSVETTLSASVSSTAATITVASSLGLIPTAVGFVNGSDTFAIAIDPDTAQEEICWVTSVDNTTKTLTIERGKADTTGIAHANGATVKHVLTGEDMKYLVTETDDSVKKSTVAAKGDLYAGTANDTVGILTAGTNERRLVTDSTQATGLKYVADTTNYAIAAKGDLLAGTAADTLQAVTVGANGSSLLADSTATPGVAWSATQVGKNILINADLTINERGNTTSTLTTSAKFAADRFFARRTSGSTGAQYEYLTSTSLDAFPNAVRIQRNSGDITTDTLVVGQTVESANSIPLQGKTVVFSFWARKGANFSAASDALQVRVYTGTGSNESGLGNGYTGTATPISGAATLTTSWQRFSFTGTIATTATQIQVTTQCVPVGTAGAADSFDVTGFQLEVGSVATPFALAGGGNRSAELNLCRRYYERWTSDSAYMRFGNGFATGATTAKITIHFKVRKRVAVTNSDNLFTALLDCSNDTAYTMTSYSFDQAGRESVTMNMTASSASFTTGELVEFVTNNITGAYQGWTSEIG